MGAGVTSCKLYILKKQTISRASKFVISNNYIFKKEKILKGKQKTMTLSDTVINILLYMSQGLRSKTELCPLSLPFPLLGQCLFVLGQPILTGFVLYLPAFCSPLQLQSLHYY